MLQTLIHKYQSLSTAAQQELMFFLEDLLEKQEKTQLSSQATTQKIESIIYKYQGIGKGIWHIDAQDYIQQVRGNDRI